MAKKQTVPLWARDNTGVRVPPPKPDTKPNWMRENNRRVAKQSPIDPVSRALSQKPPRPAHWPPRPSVAEFVAVGYLAEDYERYMTEWESSLSEGDKRHTSEG